LPSTDRNAASGQSSSERQRKGQENVEPSIAERILALLDHLGIGRAHFATQMPGDVAGLAEMAPSRIAGLALVVPTRLDPTPFAGVAERLLLVPGETGITAEAVSRAMPRLPGARSHVLGGYAAAGWSDVALERGDELAAVMRDHFDSLDRVEQRHDGSRTAASAGTHAGLDWRSQGEGPALVLLPFFLAASQWEPIAEDLARHFRVIRLGGPHIGGVAALEDRARAPSYRSLLSTLIDIAAPRSGDRVLDVGCGSGALSRLLAERLGPATVVDGVDVNLYLLGEARSLAKTAGLGERLQLREGSAGALPFADNSFDCAFSVTVLEECDADQAIAEMVRVTKPGGRVGIIVRAIDMPQWWSMDLDPDLKSRAETPPQSVAPGGVADKSLYARMRRAGLASLVPFPQLVTFDRPGSTIWRYREDHVLSQLDAAETKRWRELAERARDGGGWLHAHAMHCAVATKPG
jgi:ubiquinone/menaquinone biosynthesis C-methylase UbiE